MDPATLTLLNTLPALPPPLGVESNFENPYSQGPILTAVGSVIITLMMLFFSVRMYTKMFIQKKFSWDDLSCAIAAYFAIVEFACCIYAAKGKFGIHQWDIRLLDILSNNNIIPVYLVDVLSAPSMLFMKLTFFLLYLQLFRSVKLMRLSIYAGLIFTVGFYLAVGIAQFVYATPHPGQTFIETYSKKPSKESLKLAVPFSAVGVGIDLYILMLPMVIVSKLQMPKSQKIGVNLIFATGSIAVISSVFSLYFRVILNQNVAANASSGSATDIADFSWYLLPIFGFVLVEICVGVMCSCMPQLASFFRHHVNSYRSARSKGSEESTPKEFSHDGSSATC